MFNKEIKADCKQRINKLRLFDRALEKESEAVADALAADFNKPLYESFSTEISFISSEIRYIAKNLYRWAKAKKQSTPKVFWPGSSWVVPQPLGRVLVFAPWNYPFQLSVGPALAAFAAGNSVVLKPSYQTRETGKIIKKLISSIFEPEEIEVIIGDRNESNRLLEKKWDLIFFTGSQDVGRMILKKAGENMTPCVLELGGKSPCIVAPEANISDTAKRIVWGKFVNAGQTCVAPDYILVHESIQKDLIDALKNEIQKQYADLSAEGFPSIISDNSFERIRSLIVKDELIYGGGSEAESRQILPTLVKPEGWNSPVMKGEIFGPVLPILTWMDVSEIEENISRAPEPLAVYYFGDKEKGASLMNKIPFGGGCINDVLIHTANDHIPFGGVGSSGMGNYHGKYGFDTFSHYKGIIVRGHLDFPIRYRPHSDFDLKITKKLIVKG